MLKRKIVVVVLGLVAAITLTIGTNIVSENIGLDAGAAVHACSGGNSGGGC